MIFSEVAFKVTSTEAEVSLWNFKKITGASCTYESDNIILATFLKLN
jgi:hypothetical protein